MVRSLHKDKRIWIYLDWREFEDHGQRKLFTSADLNSDGFSRRVFCNIVDLKQDNPAAKISANKDDGIIDF